MLIKGLGLVFFKGGGSAGGGGQSGQVDYPAYMKTFHNAMLDHTGTDTPTNSIIDLIDAAITGNPFTGESAYDPSTPLAAMNTAIATFNTSAGTIDPDGDWEDAVEVASVKFASEILPDSMIREDVEALRDTMIDSLDFTTLPRFRAGMRDINAVMSSSFAIGQAIIEASVSKELVKHGSELQIKMRGARVEAVLKGAEAILRHQLSKIEFDKAVMHYTIEAERLEIVAEKEEGDQNLLIDEKEALWPLEAMMFGGNMLASIAGAATVRESCGATSGTRSVLGGAISGAATGAAISGGNPIGIGIGAVLGGLSGLL